MSNLDNDIEAYQNRIEWLLADSMRLIGFLDSNTEKIKKACEKLDELMKQKEGGE